MKKIKINLIPMAGLGQRFLDKGFSVPKPLIQIDGIPMVVKAYRALPKSDRNILVCRKEHIEKYELDKVLNKYIPNLIIVDIDYVTEGQAMTCMLAKEYIPDDCILTIGASDNDMTYDNKNYEKLLKDEECDGFVWTFKNNPSVLQDPKMYGWAKEENEIVKEVFCKIPLSKNPMTDHALVGAFTFKNAKFFFDAVNSMVENNFRINNEFYIDSAINFAVKSKKTIKVFEVDEYICWGTPQDYINYNYWMSYFRKRNI
tara:strand:- start:61 stop:834 length:774 start_codon:yes stop_codon:yes gene_type:complete